MEHQRSQRSRDDNPRNSILQTPVEWQAPTFPRPSHATPAEPTIPQSPVSPIEHDRTEPFRPSHPPTTASPPPAEKARISRSPTEPLPVPLSPFPPQTQTPRPSESTRPSPRNQAPTSPRSLSSHARSVDDKSPLHPTSPPSAAAAAAAATNRHTYNPASFSGPNGPALESHQPGQIAHPNMRLGVAREWTHSLCDVGDPAACCVGLFLPCVLYGRTQYRLERKAQKKDATDLLGYSACNGACGLMCAVGSCGLAGLLTLLQRTRVRKSYDLPGAFGGDCLRAVCCTHCSLIQAEREVRAREEERTRHAGPSGGGGYAPANGGTGMVYARTM
ncbi:MAG: hypothetical protein M1833_006878 [Piccolia ochrophora]|nr:MAG: hypothetical protein M1833_006878 [Piccolia ochrophora]